MGCERHQERKRPKLSRQSEAHPTGAGELADLFGQEQKDRVYRVPPPIPITIPSMVVNGSFGVELDGSYLPTPTAGIGACFSLPWAPARVSCSITERALSRGGGNGSKCPSADPRPSLREPL